MRASRFALAAGLFLLVGPPDALAAPDLTVSATHAAPTFLRATAPNTTVYAGTLTLTVRNEGPDPTDGTRGDRHRAPPHRARLADQQPRLRRRADDRLGHRAGPARARRRAPARAADALAPGASYPPITRHRQRGQQRRGLAGQRADRQRRRRRLARHRRRHDPGRPRRLPERLRRRPERDLRPAHARDRLRRRQPRARRRLLAAGRDLERRARRATPPSSPTSTRRPPRSASPTRSAPRSTPPRTSR